MISTATSHARRRLRWMLGLDSSWKRPLQLNRQLPWDIGFAAVVTVYTLVTLGTQVSLGRTVGPIIPSIILVVLPGLAFALRRVAPNVSLGFAALHVLVVAVLNPAVATVFGLQVYYFITLFSAFAWSRRRWLTVVLALLQLAAVLAWVVLDFAVRGGYQHFVEAAPQVGPFNPGVAAILQTLIGNVTFWLAGVWAGAMGWHAAQREARALELADALDAQSLVVRDQAIVQERLRVARDLHDIVGHYLTVIGLQAGGARRVLTTRPDDAAEALTVVEATSRSATRELQLMLGTLRSTSPEFEAEVDVGLVDVPPLVDSTRGMGLAVEYTREGLPDADVPTSVGRTLYRCIQETLNNVRKHSTANYVSVDLRIEDTVGNLGMAALTVTDNGRPRHATSGSQVGIAGLTERIELHGGSLRTGQTEHGGYRVTVALPFVLVEKGSS